MKCRNCAAEIAEFRGDTVVCEYCRSTFHRSEIDPSWKPDSPEAVKEVHHYHHETPHDRLSPGLGCLIFFFFPVGWAIYFIYRESSPKKARTALIIAAVMTVFMLIGILSGEAGR